MIDFVDILDEYKIAYLTEGNSHCRVGWVQFDCPYCGHDTQKYHMGYNVEFRYTNCWQCGPHSTSSVLHELTGLSYDRINKYIKELPRKVHIPRTKRTGKLKYPEGLGRLEIPHKRYLQKRGFDYKKLGRVWGIQGIGIAADLQWRIWIPVYYKGEVVSWTTRSINETSKAARYINAPATDESMSRTSLLYGEDYCRHAIIICEGPTDAWAIGPGAVALLGLQCSNEQIERILKYPVRAVCFDSQPEAQRRAKQLSDTLALYPGDTFQIKLDSKDAGCATKKEIRKIRSLLK